MASWKPAARLSALNGSLDLPGGVYTAMLVVDGWLDSPSYVVAGDIVTALGEVTDPGYTRQSVTWQAPFVDAAGIARVVHDQIIFGAPLTNVAVGGFYILGDGAEDASRQLLFHEMLDVTVVGDTLVVSSPLDGAVVLS